MALWGWLLGWAVQEAAERVMDRVGPNPLRPDGKPIDTDWGDEPSGGLQLELHRAELEPAQLYAFLPRLGRCLDRGLEENQLEILRHRVDKLALKKSFHVYYTVVHREVVTNLEVIIENQLRGSYVIVLRGIGPAMDALRQELARFQTGAAMPPPVPAAVMAPVAAAEPTPVAPATQPTEIPDDGVLRLAPDRKAWRALLPFFQGHVLGHRIYVMVENNRMEADIQPQQADHQLLMQIFSQLSSVTEQVVKALVERVPDPESLRSLHEPMICLHTDRADPQSWTFYLTQQLPSPARLALEFRGTQLLR